MLYNYYLQTIQKMHFLPDMHPSTKAKFLFYQLDWRTVINPFYNLLPCHHYNNLDNTVHVIIPHQRLNNALNFGYMTMTVKVVSVDQKYMFYIIQVKVNSKLLCVFNS